jgi:hypothetical protein
MLDVTRHARRLAEQRFHFHIDRIDAEMGIGHRQVAIAGRFADHGKRAALALAHGLEFGDTVGRNGQHVTFLRFVGPDFGRRHARLFGRHLAQIEHRTDATRVGQFRQGVGNATGTDVMHRQDRIVLAHLPAAVDDFLRTALDFRVAALHRGEIKVFGIGTGRHRRSGTATEADQHAGTAELDELGADREGFILERLLGLDAAQTAGDHDRLVVATHRTGDILLIGAEIAGQIRAAEFVVECCRANRAFEHDVERRGDARRTAVGMFPRLRGIGQIEVGDRETAEAGLRLGTLAGSAFVADFAAGTGRGAGERRNRRRVIVRLDLGQDVGQLFLVGIAAVGIRVEALDGGAFDDRGVVGVGHDRALRRGSMRFADHAEQGFVLGLRRRSPRRR